MVECAMDSVGEWWVNGGGCLAVADLTEVTKGAPVAAKLVPIRLA